jgi:hypothetical protein
MHPETHTLIHNRSCFRPLSNPAQNSIGPVAQNSVGADTWSLQFPQHYFGRKASSHKDFRIVQVRLIDSPVSLPAQTSNLRRILNCKFRVKFSIFSMTALHVTQKGFFKCNFIYVIECAIVWIVY